MVPDLNMFYGNMSDFVSFPSFGFTFIIKLRNFDFKGRKNTLILSDKNDVRLAYILPNSV